MVYESDFYTTRRPYSSRPAVTSYTITKLIGGRDVGPFGETTISWPARRELSRILHRPRPHHAILHTHRFLNSEPIVNFDDETKIIRAEAGSLLRKLYSPIPRPVNTYQSYEGTLSRYPHSRYPTNIVNMSYYKDPASVSIGRGHLACMEFAGGRGYPRRPRFYADENRNIRDEIKFRSYYKKRATSPAAIPEALPTGFAAKLFHLPLKTSSQSPYKIYKHSKSYPAKQEEKKTELEKKPAPEPEIVRKPKEPSPPKVKVPEEPKAEDVESEVTFSFKRKSPSPKIEPAKVEPPPAEPAEESPALNFSIKLKSKRSSGSVEPLETPKTEETQQAEEEPAATVVMKAPSQERDSNPPSKSSSRRSSAKSLKVQEDEEPTVVTMKAPSQERDSNPPSKSSSRRSSGASRPVGQLLEEEEPTIVTMKAPSPSREKKDSNPPSKSSSRRSSTKQQAEDEEMVTMKPPGHESEESNPPSKSSSRRSSGIKKLDDTVDLKSPGSKSRSKTPDVVVSEPDVVVPEPDVVVSDTIPADEAVQETGKQVSEEINEVDLPEEKPTEELPPPTETNTEESKEVETVETVQEAAQENTETIQDVSPEGEAVEST